MTAAYYGQRVPARTRVFVGNRSGTLSDTWQLNYK